MAGIKKRKIKVLFVGAFRSLHETEVRGGVQAECRAVLEGTAASPIEWILLDTTMESLPPPPIRRRLWRASQRVGRLFLTLSTRRVDVALIYISSGLSFYEKGLMAIICKAFGCKVIIRPVSGIIVDNFRRSFVLRRYIPYILRRCDLIVCQGRSWREFYQSITHLPTARFRIVENAISSASYAGLQPTKSSNIVTLLMMGWVERNKGVFDLVEIVRKYQRDLGSVRIVFCGHGSDWEELRARISSLKLEALFEFRGWVDLEEKLRILENTDIYLMLSYREGMPNALLEAMAGGRAVIATAVGCVSEAIEDGITGYLCLPGDIEEIGLRLIELCRNRRLRTQLGAAARARVASYQVDRMAEKWNAILLRPESCSSG